MIIAIDFDGTIHNGVYPDIGDPIEGAIEAIRQIKEDGNFIIIWTCRESKRNDEMIEWLDKNKIPFDSINENASFMIEKFNSDSRKIFADIYIDDRNIGGLPKWEQITKTLNKRSSIKMDDKREIRNTSYQVVSDEEKRTVEGYAVLFDTPSTDLAFSEIIERGALDGVIEKSDVLALLNHNENRGILARCKNGIGSLELTIDEKGLKYRFEAPKTALGDELLENIRRNEVDTSSFAFTVSKDVWEKLSDGTWKRFIKKVEKIYDVSPVYNAAYSATSVYLRGKEQAESELRKQQDQVLADYWKNIENQFNF